jgi:hypothetical protein
LPCSPTPAGPTHQALTMHRHGPRSVHDEGSRVSYFRGSITRLRHWLSTLRRPGRPDATQDSLPAVGQTLPDGLDYPQGSSERFLDVSYIRPPFPSLTQRKDTLLVMAFCVVLMGVIKGTGAYTGHTALVIPEFRTGWPRASNRPRPPGPLRARSFIRYSLPALTGPFSDPFFVSAFASRFAEFPGRRSSGTPRA